MANDSPATERISSDRLRELIETYNLQCFRGDTALALEELERLRHYVATCGGTDNDGRCPMHHLAGVRSSPVARTALNELHQIDQEIFGPAASADFDPLENFAQWCLGASPDDEGMVQHIIDNARGALAHAAEIKARKSPGEPGGKWQPIETAPRDGTWIVGAHTAGFPPFVARYSQVDRGWLDSERAYRDPRHWLPIPCTTLTKRGDE